MILKALYDYYYRCSDLPRKGMELKEIGFLIVIDKDGHFLRFEDRRKDKKQAQTFLVKKHIGRTSALAANYLYDNSGYVFGYSDKGDVMAQYHTFKDNVSSIYEAHRDNNDIIAVYKFYQQEQAEILEQMQADPLWSDIVKNLSKKYSTFSFLIEGDTKIVAEKIELLDIEEETSSADQQVCIVSGKKGIVVETTTATMIPGSQATAKLVAFQVSSGYDSYGKSKGGNAPISEEAEFAYTTALNHMLRSDSRNKFLIGNRTFLFWASKDDEAGKQTEESIFNMFGFTDQEDDPNKNIEQVRKTFNAIYSGSLRTSLDDKFYILGLAPNSARIAVTYWSELPLKDFAARILRHFEDMEIADTRKEKKPYVGLRSILAAVTLGGKSSDATPNLPEAVIKSIFQGIPYPYTLFAGCIRRIRAEQNLNITRAAIIKAYLNRIDNQHKINVMLDDKNTNQGYLCGRLFAVLDKIQDEANNQHSIRERYMNSASSTPAAVFATILNLSYHHSDKLNDGRKVWFEKIKQEIVDKISSDGFPAHLDLQDQGRFFVGYYQQTQWFYTKKEEQTSEE
ncbi:MAG: type I-C CRISPR-associated protein Cas8c/Csd1 [Bacteroidales bacterium]|jgi:CRISPR-associated protein Csd1|nr:type I-C CRISPR-associated protein Cas8c/Csd1 [Bacteroidales bacterium]